MQNERDTLSSKQEIALFASDIDLEEVAERTGGLISRSGGNIRVNWGRGHRRLEWISDPLKSGRKTLYLQRGEWGSASLEICGLVMGESFIAFVYPTENKEIETEIITKDSISKINGPEKAFHPLFIKARDMAVTKGKAEAR